MRATAAESARTHHDLREMIDERMLRSVYQPIVDLDTRTPVAFEALVRGPAGSPFEMPAELFPEAERLGALAELDRAAQHAAITGAVAASLQPPTCLFVNVEPSILEHSDELAVTLAQAEAGRPTARVIVELTERALAARPADVLATVQRLRELGCGIALDDVGVDRRSLALLPILSPDVIKLDMSVVQQRETSQATAHLVNAVAAEAERSGAAVLAEGIETEHHFLRARAMGATLGQGWLFGRPGPLPIGGTTEPSAALTPGSNGYEQLGTPVEIVAGGHPLRRGDKQLLLALSRQLEAEAELLGNEVVVISTFQDSQYFTPATQQRYESLARHAAFVGVLGIGIEEDPAPNVRGGQLLASDPLQGEWDVVVIGPHFAGAFVARDVGDTGADINRRFDFHLTYERDLVSTLARALIAKIVPVRRASAL